eukprot:UN09607
MTILAKLHFSTWIFLGIASFALCGFPWMRRRCKARRKMREEDSLKRKTSNVTTENLFALDGDREPYGFELEEVQVYQYDKEKEEENAPILIEKLLDDD